MPSGSPSASVGSVVVSLLHLSPPSGALFRRPLTAVRCIGGWVGSASSEQAQSVRAARENGLGVWGQHLLSIRGGSKLKNSFHANSNIQWHGVLIRTALLPHLVKCEVVGGRLRHPCPDLLIRQGPPLRMCLGFHRQDLNDVVQLRSWERNGRRS